MPDLSPLHPTIDGAVVMRRERIEVAASRCQTWRWLLLGASCSPVIPNDGLMAGSPTARFLLLPLIKATGTPTLLWTDDGVNWQHFIADNNQPYTEGGVPFAIITRTLVQYFTTHQS